MGILKKRGRPSKAEEIAKKEQEEAENIAARKKELETLRERLKGKTVICLRDQLNITFAIESVTFLYDGVCLSDGTPDGCSLTLLREELHELMLYGVLVKEKKDGERTTCERFTLVNEDGQLSSTQDQAVDPSEVEVAQPPFVISSEGTGEPSQKEEAAKGSDVIFDCICDTSNVFARMVERLEKNGCSPRLVIDAYCRKEALLDVLYQMKAWYKEREGDA